jgi:asparagine synthase (glutamine-hydrolysing)
MCGIVGFVSARNAADPDSGALRSAVRALAHRGPDQEGIFEAPGVALGFTRLSIIDLPRGGQPMKNEDGSVVVVYNGEIWNYLELRDQLIGRGHRFGSRSDTEVLVHGYEEWGANLVDHLDGMFAFAIWDSSAQRLFLARDRFGKKPLYISRSVDGVAFGSDARSIHLVTGRPPEIAVEHVGEYVFQRYLISPRTLFVGVERLAPAHRATYDRETVSISQYWQLEVPGEPVPLAASELRALLATATERRLMSDVPIGVLLSGGVDSTAILALATSAGVPDIATFTVGFDDPVFDERHRARVAARHFETSHHEVCVSRADFLDAWSRLAWYRDEPIAEASEIPLLLLSEFAGHHVRVALSGDGGDEVFGGYPKYRADALLRSGGRAAALAMRASLGIMGRRPTYRQLGRAADTLAIRDPLIRWVSWFRTPGAVTKLLSEDGQEAPVPEALAKRLGEALEPFDLVDESRRMLLGDLATYLPDNMLLRTDKVLMAGSIEGRMPLMDVRLVERAIAASAGSRSALAKGKGVLREAVEDLIPGPLLNGPKRGFPVPLESLLVNDGRVALERLLLSDRFLSRDIFNPDRVRKAVPRDSKERLPDRALFVLASFELWARANVDDVTVVPKPSATMFERASADEHPPLAAVG